MPQLEQKVGCFVLCHEMWFLKAEEKKPLISKMHCQINPQLFQL